MEYLIDIPGRLHSVAVEKHIAGTDQIYDDLLKTTQDILNLENITDVKVQDGKLQFLNIQGQILKEISIASEQKQSDWNQTDSTQVDFIKNKPTIYNKQEVDDKLITKQDIINDLVTIRSGAELGAAAYQKPQAGIPATDLSSDVQSDLAAIGSIKAVIPEQASSSNKLADKNFVNSSIATATATYRGAYNLVTDLSLTISATHAQIATALATAIQTADNNDYCYVQIPVTDETPAEIASVERYKFGTAWEYEYTLNNSGFTAAQWAALNSGITSGLVAKLSALPTNNELITLLNDKVDKIEGKGLSANDYTDSDKEKVSSITLPGETYVISQNQWILDGNIATNSEGVLKIEATSWLTPTIVNGRLVLTRSQSGYTPSFKIYSPFEGTLRIRCYEWVDGLKGWKLELGYLTDYPEKYHYLEPFYESFDNTDIAIYVKAGWNTISGGSGGSNNSLIIGGISLQKGILALNSRVTEKNMGLMTPQLLSDLNYKTNKVSNATNGNFAALDSNGNLTDSGHKHSDYITSHQDLSNYVQKSNTQGLLKNDGTVDTTQYLSQHQDISGKADKSEMSVVQGTGANADKTTITLKQGTSATVLTAHQDISGKENVMPITTATGATLSAVVGNYYRLDNVGALAITLPTITGATKIQAITFLLVCGSSAVVTFVPQDSETILYQEDFALEADTTYEVTALWNGNEWTLSRVIYE